VQYQSILLISGQQEAQLHHVQEGCGIVKLETVLGDQRRRRGRHSHRVAGLPIGGEVLVPQRFRIFSKQKILASTYSLARGPWSPHGFDNGLRLRLSITIRTGILCGDFW
jgi:hypothetical protein